MPEESWTVQDLSAEAGVSIGLTSRVKQRLIDFELIPERASFLTDGVFCEKFLCTWLGRRAQAQRSPLDDLVFAARFSESRELLPKVD